MTEINLSIQFDHSAAVRRMGKVKAAPCLRERSPAGERCVATKDEEDAASSGASIGRFGTGVTVLEPEEKEHGRFSVKALHLCTDLSQNPSPWTQPKNFGEID